MAEHVSEWELLLKLIHGARWRAIGGKKFEVEIPFVLDCSGSEPEIRLMVPGAEPSGSNYKGPGAIELCTKLSREVSRS